MERGSAQMHSRWLSPVAWWAVGDVHVAVSLAAQGKPGTWARLVMMMMMAAVAAAATALVRGGASCEDNARTPGKSPILLVCP